MANINDDFIRQIEGLLPGETQQLIGSLRGEPEVSVRINGRKTALSVAGGSRVPWCGEGFYLSSRPAFTFDPLFHAGTYYVQDASSMFISHILKHLVGGKTVSYLDLCAAPGGKTTAAIDALSDGSLVVCNEIDRMRAQILRENVTKWGTPNCIVTNGDARALGTLHHFFDVIAADMPCSGEGMFRKDEEAVAQWSPALVRQCAARQREIAEDIWDALKPGGFFIYSTCTFNREENELMAEHIAGLGAESVGVPVEPAWGIRPGIATACCCHRFFPHSVRGEGLFVAVFRKNGSPAEKGKDSPKAKKAHDRNNRIPEICKSYLSDPGRFALTADGETVTAILKEHQPLMKQVAAVVRVLSAGIPLAAVKGKSVIPSQALAQSTAIERSAFPCAEVGYREAAAYLRGESFTLDSSLPNGYILITYKGFPLGFMKNLGNRANNCYPKEWRIKSSFVPETPPEVIQSV